MPRVLAIDYGLKRTGLAETDNSQIIASALTTIETKELFHFIEKYLMKNEVVTFVLGEPKRLNNTDTHSSEAVRQLRLKLAEKFPHIPVVMIDERFTSKMAFQTMIDAGLSKKKRQDKALIDQVSATIILQSYLDSRK